ncbi:Nitrogen permease regulator 3 [Blastocladiella emersonii ATCC 22665]|nr:Nitrogen permease regulator 3 [Blastocladiella emersonii ATCC 22665]
MDYRRTEQGATYAPLGSGGGPSAAAPAPPTTDAPVSGTSLPSPLGPPCPLLCIALVVGSSRGHHIVTHHPPAPAAPSASAAAVAPAAVDVPYRHLALAPLHGRVPLALARENLPAPIAALSTDAPSGIPSRAAAVAAPAPAGKSTQQQSTQATVPSAAAAIRGGVTDPVAASSDRVAVGGDRSRSHVDLLRGVSSLGIDAGAGVAASGTVASGTSTPAQSPSLFSPSVAAVPPLPAHVEPLPSPAISLPDRPPTSSAKPVPPPPSSPAATPESSTLFGFDLPMLADLLAPKPACCDTPFELQVGDLIFVGLPVALTGAKLAPQCAGYPGMAPYYRHRMARYANANPDESTGEPCRGRGRGSNSQQHANDRDDVGAGGGGGTDDDGYALSSESDDSDSDSAADGWQADESEDEEDEDGDSDIGDTDDEDDDDADDLSGSEDDDERPGYYSSSALRSPKKHVRRWLAKQSFRNAANAAGGSSFDFSGSDDEGTTGRPASRRSRRKSGGVGGGVDARAAARHALHINMFHVVFVVADHGPATREWIEGLYRHVAVPLTWALRHEQLRHEYICRQAERLLAHRDRAGGSNGAGAGVVATGTASAADALRREATSASAASRSASTADLGRLFGGRYSAAGATGPTTAGGSAPPTPSLGTAAAATVSSSSSSSLVQLFSRIYDGLQRGVPTHVVVNHHVHLTLQVPPRRVPLARDVLALDELEPDYDYDESDDDANGIDGSSSSNPYSGLPWDWVDPDPVAVAVDPASVRPGFFPLIRSYHSLALVEDREVVLRSLPADASPLVAEFVRWFRPHMSFTEAHIHFQVPLYQVLRVAAHLLFWGKARLVHPVSLRNVVALDPDADLREVLAGADVPGSLAREFRDRFAATANLDLTELLVALSTGSPRFLSAHVPNRELRSAYIDAVALLVARGVLVQLHTYVYLKVPEILVRVPGLALSDFEQLCGAEGAPAVLGATAGYSGAAGAPRPEQLKCTLPAGIKWEDMPAGVRDWVRLVGATQPGNLAAVFERVAPYFTGRFHTDEIMYRTGTPRRDLKAVLAALPSLPDTVIDRVLCLAVRMHDPDEAFTLQRYTRVLPRDRAPCVHRTLENHVTAVSMDEASATGQLNVLDYWCRSSRPLEYTGRAISDAATSYRSLDWWRRSDLPLPESVNAYQVLKREPEPPGDGVIASFVDQVRNGSLDSVRCVGVRITISGASALADAMAAPSANVASVDLECCDVTFDTLCALRLPESVTELELMNNWAGVGAAAAAAAGGASPFPPRLGNLDLDGNNLGSPEDAVALFRLLPPTLHTLRFTNIALPPAYTRALAAHMPPALTHLGLVHCQMGTEGIVAIAPRLPATLLNLMIHDNDITTKGAMVLARHLPPRLENLSIGPNPIMDEGVVALAAKLPPSLHTLWLCNTGTTDVGAVAVMGCVLPRLKNLSFTGAILSHAVVELIFAQVPPSLTWLCFADATDPETGELPDVSALLPNVHPGLQVDLE